MLSVQPIKYAPGNVSSLKKVSFKGENTTQTPKKEDLANNGKFDIKEGGRQLWKGFVSPLTTLISSVESAGVAVGIGIAGFFLVKNVRAAGPILTAAGTGFGLFQLGKSIFKFSKAQNGDDKEKALYNAGSGLSTIALSVATAKPILKNSGLTDEAVKVAGMTDDAANATKAAGVADEAVKTPKALNTFQSYKESLLKLGDSIKTTWKQTIGKLDDPNGPGLFEKLLQGRKAFKDFKTSQATVGETLTGAEKGVAGLTTVLDPNQKSDIDLIRA